MLDLIKRIITANEPGGASGPPADTSRGVRVATCALFVAMAQSDDDFSRAEYDHVVALLRKEYDLSDEHAQDLLQVSGQALDGSIDFWQFTNLINQSCGKEEKLRVVELIWKIVYADGHLDDHERLLVRKLAKMLRVTEREMIDAKLRVLHGEGDAG
ncbi:MAG: TerB family tellurite resistance protein [Candidatus Krumholzibacteriia bacterium]